MIALGVTAACGGLLWAPAHAAGPTEEDVPATSVVPAGSEGSPAASAPTPGVAPTPAGAASPSAAKPKTVRHRIVAKAERDLEPANARLKLTADTWVFSEASKWSKHIERAHTGKFVIVTGATRSYLEIKLKSGATGYIEQSAVEMVKPTDKVFMLTNDAGVLDKPSRWAKKVSSVHRGHNVHVVGIALNYAKIRMKSGLEGYIPITALQ